jgi:hypothetical protein
MKTDELTFTIPLSLYKKMLKALPESMFKVGKGSAILIMEYSLIYEIVMSYCLYWGTLFIFEFLRNAHFSEMDLSIP